MELKKLYSDKWHMLLLTQETELFDQHHRQENDDNWGCVGIPCSQRAHCF